MYRRFFFVAALAALITSLAPSMLAQSNDAARGWGARRALAAQTRTAQTAPTTGTPETDGRLDAETVGAAGQMTQNFPCNCPSSLERERQARRLLLVGTWRIHIPLSDGGLAPFNAFHTFHDGGTFTESSDLLANLAEGPAHGIWTGERPEFLLTFELFVFDENRNPAGIIRVRNDIRMTDDINTFTGRYIVDFIAPDGSVATGIDTGTYQGTRVRILPAQ